MKKCKCSDDNKIIGTYCRYCEPQDEIDVLKNELEFYKNRDGKASFQFMYDDGVNPFNIAEMSIADYGVSDNIYSLSCDFLQNIIDKQNKPTAAQGEGS